jgi:hypothetical protein
MFGRDGGGRRRPPQQKRDALGRAKRGCLLLRACNLVRQTISRLLQGLAAAGERMLSTKAVIAGVPVHVFTLSDSPDRHLLTIVQESLVLLGQISPRHLGRLRSHVRRIRVQNRIDVAGAFEERDSTMILSAEFLMRPDVQPLDVASVLVHETTHARIAAAGIRYTPELTIRIERVCIDQQLTFARLLPEEAGSLLTSRLRDKRDNAESLWSTEAILARQDRALTALDSPKWLRRFLSWLSGRTA